MRGVWAIHPTVQTTQFANDLAAGMAPWLVPLGQAAVRAFKERSDAELLLWAWALVVFVFFSASGSKLPPYILPIFPALAVLAARSLTRGVLIAQSLVMLPVALGAGLAVHRLAAGGPYAGYASWILFAALILAATAAAALFLARRDRLLAAVLALALGGLAATQIGLAGHRTLSERFRLWAAWCRLFSCGPAS